MFKQHASQLSHCLLRLVVAVSLSAGLLSYAKPGFAEPTERPNVVLFLVDDLGWADLGCYGSSLHETPNIDALANSGFRFTNAYAACPVCSPTRASILTGRHPVRVDITDWIPGMDSNRVKDRKFEHIDDRDNLALAEVTLAEHLKEAAGYQTFFLGKWHLGDTGNLPTDQGFDVNIGGCDKGSPPGGYYAPWKNPNLTAKEKGEYLTTRLTDEANGLIEKAVTKPSPFFMMLSYYNVHSPITPDRRTIDHYTAKADKLFEGESPVLNEREGKSRTRQDNPAYASMVGAVDRSVGRVLDQLKQSGVDKNTLIVFFSDNGGLCTVRKAGPTCNLPLRSGKGWLYEGGIREPMLVRLPEKQKRGSSQQTVNAIACSTDIFPTILDVVGLPLHAKLHADGKSLLPVLLDGSSADKDRAIYWHYPHYHGSTWTPGAAVREGQYKLIEFYEEDIIELYDLDSDIGEQNDLSESNPELANRLRTKLQAWQTSMHAKMPQRREGL